MSAHDYYFCMCTLASITLALLIVGGVYTEVMFRKEDRDRERRDNDN